MEEKKLSKKEQFEFDAINDPELKGLKKEFKRQLYALKICHGNVTKAAKMMGIARGVFYFNNNKYPLYKECFESVKEMVNDFVDDALIDKIKEGDTNAIIWYDKSRGRHRDIGTKIGIDHTNNGEKFEAQPLLFVSADQLTDEQLQQYINQNLGNANSNNQSSQ